MGIGTEVRKVVPIIFAIGITSPHQAFSSIQFWFVESRQAKQHHCDVTLHAVGKTETWVTAGSFSE